MTGLATVVGYNDLAKVDQQSSQPSSPLPPSRRGTKGLLTHHDPAVVHQLKLLAVERGTSQQRLVAEALNMLFVKHGKGPIA
jgi:hypothetical protein